MKKFFLLLTLLLNNQIQSQVTLVLEQIPRDTPKNAVPFITGNFDNWSGGKDHYFNMNDKGYYSMTLPKTKKDLEFKFTLGSWEQVETDSVGKNIENRTWHFSEKHDTIFMKIQSWQKPKSPKKSTAAKNVVVLEEAFPMPQFNRRTRKILAYLPPDYKESNRRYPVVYLHDGQNIFDDATSFAGEWGVDETLNKLFVEKGTALIVIATENGQEERLNEYTPWKNEEYGGGEGDLYLEFIVKNLKPYVDQKLRTKSGQWNTGIMGSSLGGLISYYAGLKYPDVFGKVGVFSPSFWFADESFTFAEEHGKIKKQKMYLLAGTNEDEDGETVADTEKIAGLLIEAGYKKKNIYQKYVPGGEHSEKFWRSEFEEAILWLFP